MFVIELLPARVGDAILVEYGPRERPHRLLIDGGTAPIIDALRDRIGRIPKDQRHFDLLIVTHIDVDHIGGILNVLGDRSLGLTFDDVWFNGWRHLPDIDTSDRLGPIDGEILTILLDAPDHVGAPYRWNEAFDGGPVVVPEPGAMPARTLRGGMSVTVLSPGMDELRRLKHAWTTVIRHQGWTEEQVRAVARAGAARKGVRLDEPGAAVATIAEGAGDERLGDTDPIDRWAAEPFVPDAAPANGSTIAVLAEYDGRSVLLTGDAFPTVLQRSIDRLLIERERDKLRLDGCKLAHHGSKGNTSVALLDRLACTYYLISTNGARFHHPDPEAIARVIGRRGRPVALLFNYLREETERWDDRIWKRDHGYTTWYPPDAEEGLVFDVEAGTALGGTTRA